MGRTQRPSSCSAVQVLDLPTRASRQGWLPQGSSCLHSEGTASTQGKPQSLYNLISGSFPWLLLDLWVVFTGFKLPRSSCSRRGLPRGEPQKLLPHRGHLSRSTVKLAYICRQAVLGQKLTRTPARMAATPATPHLEEKQDPLGACESEHSTGHTG